MAGRVVAELKDGEITESQVECLLLRNATAFQKFEMEFNARCHADTIGIFK